jgi:hypothetical protein
MKYQYYYILIVLYLGFVIPTQAQQKISGTLVNGGNVLTDFVLSQDGNTAIYRANQEISTTIELYATSVNGLASTIKISGDLVANGNIDTGFVLSKDGTKVFFRADKEVDGKYELYAAPVDGSATPNKITPEVVLGGGNVIDFILSEDEKTIIYLSDQEFNDKYELYAIPTDVSAPSNKISGALISGGNVSPNFVISTDGKTVIYRADQDSDDKFELYSVPTDGSTTAVKISGTLVTNGNVSEPLFIISQDGTKVLFHADKDVDEKYELYIVQADGSSAPLRVNGNLSADRDISNYFALSSDATKAFYAADHDTNDILELYSVLTTSSASLVKLSTPMTATKHGLWMPFSLSTDETKIIYHADHTIDELQELYTVLTDASAPPKKINQNLVANRAVLDHYLSKDGTRVFYRVDQTTDNIFELYSASSDAATPPIKINGNLVTNGDVSWGFTATNTGHSVIYLADQDTDNVNELYSTYGLEPLANDDPSGAIQLTVSTTCNNTLGNNTGARNSEITDTSIPTPTCGNYQGGDIWFNALAPFSGDVKISLSSVSLGGITDLGMAVYTKSSGSLVLAACASTNTSGALVMPSITTANLIANDTLFIRVWENGNNTFGNFNICVLDNNPDNDIARPTELTGKAISSSQIDLNWVDNSNNETGFIVLRSSIAIDTLAPNSTSFSDTGLTANTFFNYKVRAFNVSRNGSTNTLSIATLPLQPSIVEIIETCEGGVAYVELANAPTGQNASYRYYNSITSGDIVGEISNGFFATPILTQDTIFYAVVVIDERESAPRVAIPIKVTKGIKAELVQGTNEIISCENSVEVEAVSEDGATYQWKQNGALLTETSTKLTLTQSGAYQLIVKKNTCEVFFDFTASLNYTPDAGIQEGNEISFCNSGTLNAATIKPSNTYKWLKDGNIISSATHVIVSGSGVYTLEVTENTCTNSNDIQVTVLEIPTNQVISAAETSICPGGRLDLSVPQIEGVSYRWYKDDELLINAKESTYQASQIGTYQAEMYSIEADCGEFSEKITISIFDAPPVNLTNQNGVLTLDIPNAFQQIDWFTSGNQTLPDYQNEITITPGLGVYWAEVTYLDGLCVVKSNSIQGSEVPPTGIEDEQIENTIFEVFPNPSQNGVFYIKIGSSLDANLEFEITDALGRNFPIQIKDEKDNLKLDLSQFAKGVYYLKVINQEGILIKKLIKE